METPIPISELPILVGHLSQVFGLNGFDKAPIGHPVFEFKDRYIIYLTSQHILVEKVGEETKKARFMVAIPFYKNTLAPIIEFLTN